MGWGGWWGKGVGRGFNQSFEQNRYRYIEFCYRNAHYETKSAENRDFRGIPQFWREFPCNDIIISQKRHVLARKMRRREISPEILIAQSQEEEGAAILKI